MNPEQSRLRQEEKTENAQANISGAAQEAQEFATVDDLLRHDAAQHPVPPEVAERLNQSLAAEPAPQPSWFKRLFH